MYSLKNVCTYNVVLSISYPFLTNYLRAAVLFGFCECANTRATYILYYVEATYWWIVLILLLRS